MRGGICLRSMGGHRHSWLVYRQGPVAWLPTDCCHQETRPILGEWGLLLLSGNRWSPRQRSKIVCACTLKVNKNAVNCWYCKAELKHRHSTTAMEIQLKVRHSPNNARLATDMCHLASRSSRACLSHHFDCTAPVRTLEKYTYVWTPPFNCRLWK